MGRRITPEQNAKLHEEMERRFGERRAQIDRALTACEAEAAEHCAGRADAPPPHRLMCLQHKRMAERLSVSSQCEAALEEMPPAPPEPGGAE